MPHAFVYKPRHVGGRPGDRGRPVGNRMNKGGKSVGEDVLY